MPRTPGTTEYPAKTAGYKPASCAQQMYTSARMPAHTMCSIWAAASIAAGILLIQTGVVASVSLFVLLAILGNLLLVSLLGIVGLLSLSGLTGLVISLVGLTKGQSPGTNTGD